eukprot:1137733-Pelagomonas_calceolata.AAC.1
MPSTCCSLFPSPYPRHVVSASSASAWQEQFGFSLLNAAQIQPIHTVNAKYHWYDECKGLEFKSATSGHIRLRGGEGDMQLF